MNTDQQWRGMPADEAFHLIERHAGSWADAGAMMEAWVIANRDAPPAPGECVMLPPGFNRMPMAPAYAVTLSDLLLFADAACELDAYKDTLANKPAERERIMEMLDRVHNTVERVAGVDANFIYSADDSHMVFIDEGAAW